MRSRLPRTMVALAALAVLLATACFAAPVGSEPTPTPDTSVAQDESTPLTPESLLAELRARGMEFEYEGYARGQPFIQMNGFVHREGVTGKFVWGEEQLWVHEFTGPGEALVAATRIDKDGGSYMMPTRHGQWVGGGGYGIEGPLYYFLRGNIIVEHIGDSEEIPAVLEDLMGKPFAGSPYWNQEVEPEERLPAFEHMWKELTTEAEFVSAESFGGRSHGLSYRIEYRAYRVHSFACSGELIYDQETDGQEVVGNEVRLTLVQRIVDTDVVKMSEPCDMEWKWGENSAIVHGLTAGETYSILINGEQVAQFTAEG